MRDGKNTQLKWHFENCNNLTCLLESKEYIDLSYFHSLYLTVAFLYCSIENEDGKNIFTFSFVMLHLSGIFVLFHGKRKKHLHISIYHVAIIGHRHNLFPIVLKFDLFAYPRLWLLELSSSCTGFKCGLVEGHRFIAFTFERGDKQKQQQWENIWNFFEKR